MKQTHLIIALLFLFLLVSCEPVSDKSETTPSILQTENLINKMDIHDLEILEIENCEYIFYKKGLGTNKGFGFMAHKGNCKNPIHIYNNLNTIKDSIPIVNSQ